MELARGPLVQDVRIVLLAHVGKDKFIEQFSVEDEYITGEFNDSMGFVPLSDHEDDIIKAYRKALKCWRKRIKKQKGFPDSLKSM